jgi:hypothetical protein
MRPGIELRTGYDAARPRALAKATRNAGPSQRLLALAEIYDGGTRTKAARVGGVGLQTVRYFRGAVQCPWARSPGRRQGTGECLQAERPPPRGLARPGRKRPDSSRPWGGAFATGGPGALALGRVPDYGERDDAGRRTAGAWLPQALGPPAASRQERCRCGQF